MSGGLSGTDPGWLLPLNTRTQARLCRVTGWQHSPPWWLHHCVPTSHTEVPISPCHPQLLLLSPGKFYFSPLGCGSKVISRRWCGRAPFPALTGCLYTSLKTCPLTSLSSVSGGAFVSWSCESF